MFNTKFNEKRNAKAILRTLRPFHNEYARVINKPRIYSKYVWLVDSRAFTLDASVPQN